MPLLLREAAAALEDGRDPLTTPFLSDFDVTLDECYDMAGWLAVGARLVAWAHENPKQAVIAARGAGDSLMMDAIIKALRKLNGEDRSVTSPYVREVGTVADASSGRADLMPSTTLDPRKAV
jgi:hypothetical protein